VLWRDPFSLQFGVDPARVILRDVTDGDERVIAALRSGVTEAGLAMVGASGSVSPVQLERTMASLAPVLLPQPVPPTSRATAAVVGTGVVADLVSDALGAAGVGTRVSPEVQDEACDVAVAIGHYVLNPREYGFWLRRDIPHLPVVFGDGQVTVGPLVSPGRTACLYCLEHHRRDADAAWAALASQLWGRRSAAQTPLVAREAAVLAARTVLRSLTDGSPAIASPALSLRLDAATGELTRREWMPHPECGCIELASAALARIGSAPG
jgi:bacteriocin biosynthesis cyclodehydratase domain-containing protein